MRTLEASSEDSDEMLHDAAFHWGLYCLLKTKMIFRERNTILLISWKRSTCWDNLFRVEGGHVVCIQSEKFFLT